MERALFISRASRPSCRAHQGCTRGNVHQQRCGAQQHQVLRTTVRDCRKPCRLACRAAESAVKGVDDPRTLTPEEEVRWRASVQQLETLGFEAADAEAKLQKGFGWVHSAYWRQDKVQEVPEEGQVEAVIAYLTSLGLSPGDVVAVLAKFPEALGCSITDRLQANIAKLEKEWKTRESQVF